jgi:hypothetical protein
MNPKEQAASPALTRESILAALGALSDGLSERGVMGEVCLFGGTVMVLAFAARVSTQDVDALFRPAQVIRDLARRIGEEQDLPEHWLNDRVKGYVSSRHDSGLSRAHKGGSFSA